MKYLKACLRGPTESLLSPLPSAAWRHVGRGVAPHKLLRACREPTKILLQNHPMCLLADAESFQISAVDKLGQAFGRAWLALCVTALNLNSRVQRSSYWLCAALCGEPIKDGSGCLQVAAGDLNWCQDVVLGKRETRHRLPCESFLPLADVQMSLQCSCKL